MPRRDEVLLPTLVIHSFTRTSARTSSIPSPLRSRSLPSTFTDVREMAARVKALLGGRAKDAAFLRAPSGGQKTNHGKKSLITKLTFLHFFQLKRPEKSYTTALALFKCSGVCILFFHFPGHSRSMRERCDDHRSVAAFFAGFLYNKPSASSASNLERQGLGANVERSLLLQAAFDESRNMLNEARCFNPLACHLCHPVRSSSAQVGREETISRAGKRARIRGKRPTTDCGEELQTTSSNA